MMRFTAVLFFACLLLAPVSAQSTSDLQDQIDDLYDELEGYRDLYRELQRRMSEMSDVQSAENQSLRDMLDRMQMQMGDVVPPYITEDEEEFDNKIRRILDDRFRDYTRGTGWLKGEPGVDSMEERIGKSFNYLTIGAEMVTAAQVFSGLDPFDDRPDLQRALALTRLSLRWEPSDNLAGVIEGQWFGNFGASDTRFEDFQLVTPRTGSALDLPLELTQPRDITMPDLDPLLLTPSTQDIPNDVFQLYQAYFDIKNLFDLPIGIRIGRQELELGERGSYGNEFLYGNNDTGDLFFGQSFDGGKIMLADDKDNPKIQLDAWWYKPDELEETAFLEDDSSPDFVGVYGSYTGLAGNEFFGKFGLDIRRVDMGWTLIRNPATTDLQSPSPLPFGLRNTFYGSPLWQNDPAQRFIDRSFSDVRYLDSDELHTMSWYLDMGVGERVNVEANFAVQFGDTARRTIRSALSVISPFDGFPINPGNITLPAGDYESYAVDLYVDVDLSDTMLDARTMGQSTLSPRLGLGYAFFDGGDAEDFLVGDINTFQRLVADRQYGEIMDRAPFGSFLSNVHIAQAKVSLTLSDRLSFDATGYGYWVDETSDVNGPFFGANQDIFGLRESLRKDLAAFGSDPDLISPLTATQRNPGQGLGAELDLLLTYVHNPQMSMFVGYSRFFEGAYFQDALPDTNVLMHQLFGDEFGSQFDVDGNLGQDYFFVQFKVDF